MTRMDCPYCEGRGCSECDGTGERHTTFIEIDGGYAMIHGNAELSAEAREAMAGLMRLAFIKADEITQSERDQG
jgi:hypothetical protein